MGSSDVTACDGVDGEPLCEDCRRCYLNNTVPLRTRQSWIDPPIKNGKCSAYWHVDRQAIGGGDGE